MTRAISLLAVTSGILLLSGCGKAEFKEFSSTKGKFKVQMPGTPKEQTQNAGGVPVSIYMIEERNGAYAVFVADMPIPAGEPPEQIQARLDGARDGAIKNAKAKLTSESKITLAGKYPGREINASLPNKDVVLRAKVYIVDRRLYQMLVTGTKSWANSADASKFLNSLVVTP